MSPPTLQALIHFSTHTEVIPNSTSNQDSQAIPDSHLTGDWIPENNPGAEYHVSVARSWKRNNCGISRGGFYEGKSVLPESLTGKAVGVKVGGTLDFRTNKLQELLEIIADALAQQ